MIKKACPACKSQVAVACKSCKCGHSFFNARARKNSQKVEVDGAKRRTGRVRREKPQFYDPSKFENKRKRNKRKNSAKYPIESNGKSTRAGTRLRGPRGRTKKIQEETGGSKIAELSEEKQKVASIILAEINQKLGSVVWNP
ncbi:UPF0547 protein C16orf87 homolog [Lutzomyia longipalpis]|uniref:Uncharacterized protein n=1 Tax=Lutzomyia longipalpis TaxID=7200 RepID=A0A1B0GHU5_LUTLO|nr:UPF0547 protein C16orf87 homolog [Lutzomyia longipalpis]